LTRGKEKERKEAKKKGRKEELNNPQSVRTQLKYCYTKVTTLLVTVDGSGEHRKSYWSCRVDALKAADMTRDVARSTTLITNNNDQQ